jgi:hypothetical protein
MLTLERLRIELFSLPLLARIGLVILVLGGLAGVAHLQAAGALRPPARTHRRGALGTPHRLRGHRRDPARRRRRRCATHLSESLAWRLGRTNAGALHPEELRAPQREPGGTRHRWTRHANPRNPPGARPTSARPVRDRRPPARLLRRGSSRPDRPRWAVVASLLCVSWLPQAGSRPGRADRLRGLRLSGLTVRTNPITPDSRATRRTERCLEN